MRVRIEDIIPHEEMMIDVRVTFWDGSRRPHNGADMHVFIPQKDYTLSELKEVTLAEARKFLEKCLSDEWEYKATDAHDPIVLSSSDEQD
jgi:hypothetical protein